VSRTPPTPAGATHPLEPTPPGAISAPAALSPPAANSTPEAETRGRWAGWRVTFAYGTVVLVGGAIGVTLWHLDRHVLATLFALRSVPYLLLAAVLNLVAIVLALLSWQVLLADVGVSLRPRTSIRIFAASMLTKYLPGRLWAMVTHVRMGRAAGASPGRMASAFMLSMVVTVLAGATVAITAAPAQLGAGALWLALPVALLLACFAWPGLVGRAYLLAARLLRRPPPEVLASSTGIRRSISASVVSWLLSGLQLWAIALLFGAGAGRALLVCVGGFALASMAGGFALIVPDGWGAREVTMTVALSTILPWPAATAAAIASRIICVLTEIGGSGVLLVVTSLGRARQPIPQPVREGAPC
jgi:uncharacterized membrane protein YbhN (UPF0104 family)